LGVRAAALSFGEGPASMAEADTLNDLVKYPRESLNIELKQWFDPGTPAGRAKIAKCALAMRNAGGGFLIVGFNSAGEPVDDGRPADLNAAFHFDNIQALVTEYSSDSFEVAVHFVEHEGHTFVIIQIPAGIRTPVACKSALKTTDGNYLLRENRVYVRTLDANNTASTAEALWTDWPRIAEICFDNREADVARFVRRHLSGLNPTLIQELANYIHHVASVLPKRRQPARSRTTRKPRQSSPPPKTAESTELSNAGETKPELGPPVAPAPEKERSIVGPSQLESRSVQLLDVGFARFRSRVTEKEMVLPAHGSWEVAAVVSGVPATHSTNLKFLDLLLSRNPNYTGWPVWLDSRNFRNPEFRPYFVEDAWEALIVSLERYGHIDFWRLNAAGEFYLYRALQDDIGDSGPDPMTVLDFGLPLIRVAEAIGVALIYGKALDAPDGSLVSISFRWRGLHNRELSAWAQPNRILRPGRHAYRDEVVSTALVPIGTPVSALHTFVRAVTEPLFEVFDAFQVSNQVAEEMTDGLFNRRL
jgi:hypothetical protein